MRPAYYPNRPRVPSGICQIPGRGERRIASIPEQGSRPRNPARVRARNVLRAASPVATAGRRLPDPPGEGWHRVQEVLEAPRAHEQDLRVGGHNRDAGFASPALQQAQFAEDVALAQLADKPAFGPNREVARQKDVEPVRLVSLDEDVLALLELHDPAEDCEAGELTRGHVLDQAPGPRLQRRLESGVLLGELQPWEQ